MTTYNQEERYYQAKKKVDEIKGFYANLFLYLVFIPFFIWLNYKGWLRSDSLEELVGLDISYHGGTGQAGDKVEVKKEYVEAYRRHKGRSGPMPSRSTTETSEEWHNSARDPETALSD